MINTITPEQVSEMKVIVDKYVNIGLDTKPINKDAAKRYAKKLFAFLGKKSKPIVLFSKGPKHTWNIVTFIEEHKDKKIGQKEANELLKAGGDYKNFVYPYLDGQFFSYYIAWVKYMEYLGVKDISDYSIIEDQLEFGLIYPIDNYCIFTEKFRFVRFDKDHKLHCEFGPAIEYDDGTKIWSLNGVSVPAWLVETPCYKLDPALFATIDNVEVRREFVRKVGVEQICTKLGSVVIDKQGDYELHEIDLKGTTGKWPYLKMLNPSIGVWHMKCVAKECRTVKQALAWRNNTEQEPEKIT